MQKSVFVTLTLLLLCGASLTSAAAPKIVVISNLIDYNMALDFFGFLRNQGIDVIRITAADFPNYQTEKFIIILGGPDAYNGTGDIVRQALFSDEQNYLRTRGNRKMYVKTNVWVTGQVIIILAGSDRDQTKRTHIENRKVVAMRAKGPESVNDFVIARDELPSGITMEGIGAYTQVSMFKERMDEIISIAYGKNTTISDGRFIRIRDSSNNTGFIHILECKSTEVAEKVVKNMSALSALREISIDGYDVYYGSFFFSNAIHAIWANKKFIIMIGPDSTPIINKTIEIAKIILDKTGMPTYPIQ
ncbi:MAG: hypothetical protein HY929_03600 [Euryarchaeota archaeon]|nr:hypothetical protein [Euryarchaeota archaeon]